MTEKILGKIDFAEFGKIKDYPFLIGLQLGFSFQGGGVMDGGKYTVNICHACKWSKAGSLQYQRKHSRTKCPLTRIIATIGENQRFADTLMRSILKTLIKPTSSHLFLTLRQTAGKKTTAIQRTT